MDAEEQGGLVNLDRAPLPDNPIDRFSEELFAACGRARRYVSNGCECNSRRRVLLIAAPLVIIAVAIAVAVGVLLGGGRSTSSEVAPCLTEACGNITCSDVLLVLNLQNSYLEARPLRTDVRPIVAVPISETSNGTIKAGPLAINGSLAVLAVAQAWLDAFGAAGGHIVQVRDSHPPNHCSFCRNGTVGTNPTGFQPNGAFCLSGANLPPASVNASNRCVDPVSVEDYANDRYMQWPDNSLSGSFGVLGDPYLRVPALQVTLLKGRQLTRNSYSAFEARATNSAGTSLPSVLTAWGVKRLFVLGLGTEYNILHTVLDALNHTNFNFTRVVVLQTGTLGFDGTAASAALASMASAGAVVTTDASPLQVLAQMCS